MNRFTCEMHIGLDGGALAAHLQERIRCRVGWRVLDLEVLGQENGLTLRGRCRTYYAKQLVQHAVMEATQLPILANEIEVC